MSQGARVIAKNGAQGSTITNTGSTGRFAKSVIAVVTLCVIVALGTLNLSLMNNDQCTDFNKSLNSLNMTVRQLEQSVASAENRAVTAESKLAQAELRASTAEANVSTLLNRAITSETRVKQLEQLQPTVDNTQYMDTTLNDPEMIAMRERRNRPMPKCVKGNKPTPAFLMVFMGHSGSTAIVSELQNHSQVLPCTREPVDHQDTFNTTEALKIARTIFERGVSKGLTAGFKIRPAHILAEPEQWRALVNEFDIRIIWQYRKNMFKGAVGEYSHRYLNDTSVVEGLHSNISREERCQIGAGCSFRVDDFEFLHERLRSMIRSNRQISQAVSELVHDTGCVREVPYEDYLYDRNATMKDLMTFLGLPEENTSPSRFKATGDSLCETVENWNDVCNAFYGCTLWQHMLDDARNGCFCKLTNGVPLGLFCSAF